MKKSEKIILISILSLLTILVIFFVVMGFASCQTAYAEYEDLNGSEILYFNQIFKNDNSESNSYGGITRVSTDYTYRIYGTATASDYIYSRVSNLNSNHKYYFNCYDDTLDLRITGYNNHITSPFIFTGLSYFQYAINFYNGNTYDITIKPILIDLTLMYGIGNEPTLEQCKNIFTASYYNYQTGSALTSNGMDAYQQGVNSVYESMHYTLTASHIYNTSYAFEGEKINEAWTYENQTVIATGVTNGILAIPLGAVIEQGKTLKIYSGYIGFCVSTPNANNGLYYLCWACRYNDQFIPIVIGGTEIVDDDGYITISTPYAMDTIYLLESTTTGYITQPTSRNFGVFNTAISVVELDASALVDNAFNEGYDSALKTFEPGGSNYLKIYNQGVRDAQTSGSVFQDAWAFMGSAFEGIGSMLSVELIPNVPIGLFVAFPLLLGLVFFIVKLTKGGD